MLNIIKNTLNFKNFSLKPILMSLIILFGISFISNAKIVYASNNNFEQPCLNNNFEQPCLLGLGLNSFRNQKLKVVLTSEQEKCLKEIINNDNSNKSSIPNSHKNDTDNKE